MSLPARSALRQNCAQCAIRDRAICAYAGPEELEILNQFKSYKAYAKGAQILSEGEQTAFVGTIVTGVVALSKSLSDGRRQVVGLQFPSDFIGGAFRPRSSCDAVAATDVLLCQFERRLFTKLINKSPNLRDRMLEMTLDEVDALREWMALLGLKTAREKVASFIRMLALRTKAPGAVAGVASGPEVEIELPLTRGEIGEGLGLTIETVSRHFSKLKVEGVIDFSTPRSIRVLDLSALSDLAGG